MGVCVKRIGTVHSIRVAEGEHQGEGVGDQAAALARGVLREMTDAEEKIGMTVSGRAGRYGITATAVWMEIVIALAAAGYRPNARR